jgi:hypothetical protein
LGSVTNVAQHRHLGLIDAVRPRSHPFLIFGGLEKIGAMACIAEVIEQSK